MKLQALVALFTILTTTNAHSRRLESRYANIAHKRQAPPVSSSTSTPPPSSSSSGSVSKSGSTTGTVPASSGVPVTSVPVATGTGIPPLANITFGMPTQTTLPVTATFAAGASPPVSGAPALPTPFVFEQAAWPTQDQIPDTSSPEVQLWMKELDGFNIPNLNPTVDGSCVNDTASSNDAANRGWWTCGGYTRSTDITACPDKLTWGVSFDDGPSPYSMCPQNHISPRDY
jgi:hypothetical protein